MIVMIMNYLLNNTFNLYVGYGNKIMENIENKNMNNQKLKCISKKFVYNLHFRCNVCTMNMLGNQIFVTQ